MSSDGMRSARSVAIILIVHLAVIVLWQVLVDAFQVPKFVLPSPLATLATLLGVLIGVPMGVVGATHHGRWPDHLIRIVGLRPTLFHSSMIQVPTYL